MDDNLTMNSDQLIENLKIQISEIEMLQSMYCNPGELRIEDPKSLQELQRYVEGAPTSLPSCIDLTINLLIDNSKFELCMSLLHEYPCIEPDIFVRNQKLTKTQHAALNKDLCSFVSNLSREEPCVFSAVSWMQDNASKYVCEEEAAYVISSRPETEELIRYWIYSHHIYNKHKRREILSLANSLKLTGFCLPGKPGIICVEGNVSDCNEWWATIKSMNWKRIFCKITEECVNKESFLKFGTFEEVSFHANGNRSTHMDMGELNRFLIGHNCAYVFKDLFGVEAKPSEK